VPLSAASLNSGDVFILDLGLSVFQWNGKQSNVAERNKVRRAGNDLTVSSHLFLHRLPN
jgi:hypothetical protein